MNFESLLPLAERVGLALKARGETVAVAESSAAGLISAALLSVPGASAWYLGGAVVYTRRARRMLVDISDEAMAGKRSSSEPYAMLLAGQVREQLRASWGLAETGASGPPGNSYGDAAGHSCLAVAGPVTRVGGAAHVATKPEVRGAWERWRARPGLAVPDLRTLEKKK